MEIKQTAAGSYEAHTQYGLEAVIQLTSHGVWKVTYPTGLGDPAAYITLDRAVRGVGVSLGDA